MPRKIYDLAVKTGSYTDNTGQERGRYLNIGAVIEKDDGGQYMLLDRTFNAAGVPNPDNRPNLIVSMFEPRDRDSAPNRGRQQAQRRDPEEEEEVPF